MAEPRRKAQGRSPLFSAVGIALLAIPGFALGLLGGVAWEDPGLLALHLFGATEEVAWALGDGEQSEALPEAGVAATRPLRPAAESAASDRGGSEAGKRAALPDVAAPSPPPRPSATRLRPEVFTPAAGDERFAVQVGAFSESRSAEQLADSLRRKGFAVYVSPGTSAGESRWRVRVGPLPSREAAEQTASRLKAEERLPTWVLDENAV